jgi:Domain of unknown function (DUF4189)
VTKIGSVLIALTLATPFIAPSPAAAEGALAVGSTGDVAKDGVEIGISSNYATVELASAHAMVDCRDNNNTAPKAAQNCKVIRTFTRQCAASAFDPKTGTPGVGWAVAATQQDAESQAVSNCQATAGASRSQFCVANKSATRCDTNDSDNDPVAPK